MIDWLVIFFKNRDIDKKYLSWEHVIATLSWEQTGRRCAHKARKSKLVGGTSPCLDYASLERRDSSISTILPGPPRTMSCLLRNFVATALSFCWRCRIVFTSAWNILACTTCVVIIAQWITSCKTCCSEIRVSSRNVFALIAPTLLLHEHLKRYLSGPWFTFFCPRILCPSPPDCDFFKLNLLIMSAPVRGCPHMSGGQSRTGLSA